MRPTELIRIWALLVGLAACGGGDLCDDAGIDAIADAITIDADAIDAGPPDASNVVCGELSGWWCPLEHCCDRDVGLCYVAPNAACEGS